MRQPDWQIIHTDVLAGLRGLPAASVQVCVTSPPYLWMRDYGCAGQLGHEATIPEYIANLVAIFRAVRRVLRCDGTLWVNIADGYYNDTKWGGQSANKNAASAAGGYQRKKRPTPTGLPPKCLMALPARFQLAMIEDGWVCRSEISWHKSTARPESVIDRPSRDHEQVFLFTRSPRYYYDAEAVKQPASPKSLTVKTHPRKGDGNGSASERLSLYQDKYGQYQVAEERNLRTTWSLPAEPQGVFRTTSYVEADATDDGSERIVSPDCPVHGCAQDDPSAQIVTDTSGRFLCTCSYRRAVMQEISHFASFPTALPLVCIQAGTSERGCCPTCRAPWRRVVEREKMTIKPGPSRASRLGLGLRTSCNGTMVTRATSRTTGWTQSCKCAPAAEPLPCLVLDPFCGTGSTGVAALRAGCDFVGIDLNAEYCGWATERLRETERNMVGDLFLPLAEAARQRALFAAAD